MVSGLCVLTTGSPVGGGGGVGGGGYLWVGGVSDTVMRSYLLDAHLTGRSRTDNKGGDGPHCCSSSNHTCKPYS